LLLVLFTLLTTGARRLSLTQDEPSHIVGGYTLLDQGREGFWTFPKRGHPPLINVGQALVLFLTTPRVPVQSLDGWGDNYVSYVSAWLPYLDPIERTEVLGRTPVMLLTILLGALVFRWGKDVGGAVVGLLALLALTFNPLLLAHGRLATNDVGVTALGTAALYAAWRWMRQPSWRQTCIIGVLLGLTALSKISGVLWIGAFGGLALLTIIREPLWSQGRILAAQAATAVIFALGLIWAFYGFSVGRIAALPFPIPAPEHWEQLLRHTSVPTWRVFWALGKLWKGRQWWYYPLNFVIRTPLPLLLGLLIGGLALLQTYALRYRLIALALFPLFYILVAVSQGTTVGNRHMLPLYPFIYLAWGGGLWGWVRGGRRWRVGVAAALSLFYMVGTLNLFPHEITFFNALVGGPGQGYRYLVDYGQDWGQSFKELRTWLAKHPGPRPKIAYHTHVHPGFYGIDFDPLPPAGGAPPLLAPWRPLPGRYVIGVTSLQGIVGRDRMILEWFRQAQPTAKIGQALFVYDVGPFEGDWLAQCFQPTLPLDTASIQDGIARDDLRELAFDCEQSWLYPGGGQTHGWYALHGYLFAPNGLSQRLLYSPPQPADKFLERHLQDSRFAYQQEWASYLPPFVLYEVTAQPASPPLTQLWSAPAETPPAALAAETSLNAPLSLDGPLEFLGIRTFQDKHTLELESWWRVTQSTVTRPLSLMAHLVTADGQSLAVADGMGVPPLTWQQGDVIVQRHNFPRPADGTAVWLRTGAYWIDDGTRWSIKEQPGDDALFLALPLQTSSP
jgi:hypothetical protein